MNSPVVVQLSTRIPLQNQKMKTFVILAAVVSVFALLADGAVVPLGKLLEERQNSPVATEEPSASADSTIQEVEFSDPHNFDPAVAKKPAAATTIIGKGQTGGVQGQTEGQKVTKGQTEPLVVTTQSMKKRKRPIKKFSDEEVAEILDNFADELIAMDPAIRVRIKIRPRPAFPSFPAVGFPGFPQSMFIRNPGMMASASASAAVADEMDYFNDDEDFYYY